MKLTPEKKIMKHTPEKKKTFFFHAFENPAGDIIGWSNGILREKNFDMLRRIHKEMLQWNWHKKEFVKLISANKSPTDILWQKIANKNIFHPIVKFMLLQNWLLLINWWPKDRVLKKCIYHTVKNYKMENEWVSKIILESNKYN